MIGLRAWRRWLGAALWLVTAWSAFAQEPNSAPPASISTNNQIRVRVTEFRFVSAETNRPLAFSTSALAALVARDVGHDLGDTELEAARLRITQHYVAHGYINSGAILPDQVITNGIVVFRIQEGRLAETNIFVHGTRRLKPSYFRSRIQAGVKPPLTTNRLADALDVLRRNPNVRELVADLEPVKTNGVVVLGESALDLRVAEANPYHLEFALDNYRPPSNGAEELLVTASDQNLTRHSDALEVQYGILEGSSSHGVEFSGLDNVSVSYSIPVTVRDTTIGGFYDRRDYAVIEAPFDQLDIKSSYEGYGFRIQQPLYRGGGHSLALGLSLEHRKSEATLLGEPFSFTPGAIEGVSEATVLRLSADWTRSWINQVLATRLTASWGLDAFGATRLPSGPDGRFVAVLGQVQYAWRPFSGTVSPRLDQTQLLFRGGFQWSADPLVSMEQLSLGGPTTVRGYRVNQLVRDTGVFGSVELQIPVVRWRDGLPALQLAPFFDAGGGWNLETSNEGLNNLFSVGVALTLNLGRRVSARVDWGYALKDAHNPNNDPQDLGLLFRMSWRPL